MRRDLKRSETRIERRDKVLDEFRRKFIQEVVVSRERVFRRRPTQYVCLTSYLYAGVHGYEHVQICRSGTAL